MTTGTLITWDKKKGKKQHHLTVKGRRSREPSNRPVVVQGICVVKNDKRGEPRRLP